MSDSELNSNDLLPCPFCGEQPTRKVERDILFISCPLCISVGFHNHIRFGCRADAEWNTRQGNSLDSDRTK